jgi:hypothetical protein
MKLLRVLAVVTALTVAAGAALITVQMTGNDSKPVGDSQYWTKRVSACQFPDAPNTDKYMDLAYDCLIDAMRDSIWNNAYRLFDDALRQITATDVQLEYVCHIPGHDLGREIIEFYDGNYRKAVTDLASNLCGSGIVHGIYDVFGETNRSTSEWEMMGTICVEANQVAFNACGDALGHAAYESTGRDLTEAMQICDLASADWVQYTCANGAYMQANFPQSTKLKKIATPNRRVDPQYWPPFIFFCDQQTFKNASTMRGCYGGAGWVIGNTIYGINAGVEGENRARGLIVDERKATKNQEDLILDVTRKGIEVCRMGRDPDGSQISCVSDMLSRMPIFFYRGGLENFERYCRTLTEGLPSEFGAKCIAAAQQHVGPEEMTELISRHGDALEFVRQSNPDLAANIAGKLGIKLETPVAR